MPTMKKSKELPDAFEKLAAPVPPEDPNTFKKLAANGKAVPNVGYAREFQAATERGRAAMAQQAEQRGLDSFPPSKELKR
jgi:hypothetical protein